MARKIRVTLIVALALITVALASTAADELESQILQYKMGRLYFADGLEANIYPGCTFTIFKEADTLYTGQIEFAYRGISISRATFGLTDTLSFDNCRSVINPAGIDSTSTIELGCYGVSWLELVPHTDDILAKARDSSVVHRIVSTTENGNPVDLSDGETFAFPWDYENGRFDGFFSASIPPESIRGHATVISSPAPFFAVLLPNLDGKAARQGIVTTSLYYRFDVGQLWPTFFQTELPAPVNRLYIAGGLPARTYPYDVDDGRLLLSKHRSRPSNVTISFLNPRLENVAKYFGDVLSRDRIRVEVKPDDPDADLLLAFVPVDWNDPTVSLEYVFGLMRRGNIKDKAARENLEIIGNYIQSARSADDVSTLFHFCRLADRAFQHELGVFPLFRPSVHFVTGKRLKNIEFNESGFLDMTALTKIALPTIDEDQP